MEEIENWGISFLKNELIFYDNAKEYWSRVEPTIDGMMGGLGGISNIDINGSHVFLKKMFRLENGPKHHRALDCGAGIGRITKNLLVKHFDIVDLVEQNPKFVEAGKQFLSCETKIGNFYESGLQDFTPEKNYYDVIWCQWVLGHLTDPHLTDFLIRCKSGLRKDGLIIVKENVSTDVLVFDEEDYSVTRPTQVFQKIFENANLNLIKHFRQINFPKQLLLVKIFALQPKEWDKAPQIKE